MLQRFKGKQQLLVVFLCWCISISLFAAENPLNLTIYSSNTSGIISPNFYQDASYSSAQMIPGFALVRIQKEFELKQAQSKISLSDVASFIDPTTVMFKSLTDPLGTTVIEQNYQFDVVNNQKLLERYLGQEITAEQSLGDKIESYSGKLLSTEGGLVLQDKDNKIVTLSQYTTLRFPDLPGGLMTKPTLVWEVNTKKTGLHKIETSYQTKGITWWTDYNALFEEGKDANSGVLDLNAWVSIINKSGTSYSNAQLKLIAGDVQRLESMPVMSGMNDSRTKMTLAASAPQFAEKPFFEFHLYTLNRLTTLPDNSTKQIELFPKANKIPVQKSYIYAGTTQVYYGQVNTARDFSEEDNKKVNVYLKFKNSSKEGLGLPLPRGRIRVSKLNNNDNSMEFIGEDFIEHTAKDEEIAIKLGSAFDVVGSRKQINFNVDTTRKVMEETIEVTIKNHKEQDITVIVQENLSRGPQWKILESSAQYEKMGGFKVDFPLIVKKGSDHKLEYTVRYTW